MLKDNSCKRGVTLIELLITMSVLLVALSVIFLIYFTAVNVFSSEGNESSLRQDAESAMYLMVGDLRMAKTIKTASNLGISFWVDADGDEAEDTDEIIAYDFSGVSGEALTRTQDTVSRDILQDVTSFALSYDSTIVDNIRLITIDFKVNRDGEEVTLSSKIKPRNID
jgi:prepilin-type N-terminal cleavage/methylation domain-containing protein